MKMIYVISPAKSATGGIEALHQLAYKLRLLGYDARMFYMGNYTDNPVPAPYVKYNVPYVTMIEDAVDNTVIFPEIVIDNVRELLHARAIIWWLSVDNAKYDDISTDMIRNDREIIHFSQSQYATDFLINNFGVSQAQIYYVSDYLNSEFITEPREYFERDNVVLFNPKKGINTTVNIFARSDYRVKWQALIGLTPDKMHETMQKAKVYIDFGNHPGKDRIPREAALSGCLVMTNKRGAAANTIDVAIDNKYKMDDDDYGNILRNLYDMLENYEERICEFSSYREKTKREFMEYEVDIFNAFRNILNEMETEERSAEALLSDIQMAVNDGRMLEAFRKIVFYRSKKYSENTVFAILESTVRLFLGEYAEAKFCVEEALRSDANNYELFMTLAQILAVTKENDKRLMECLDKILLYSRGTYDEEACKAFVNLFKDK